VAGIGNGEGIEQVPDQYLVDAAVADQPLDDGVLGFGVGRDARPEAGRIAPGVNILPVGWSFGFRLCYEQDLERRHRWGCGEQGRKVVIGVARRVQVERLHHPEPAQIVVAARPFAAQIGSGPKASVASAFKSRPKRMAA
jgi:hypothetical protein